MTQEEEAAIAKLAAGAWEVSRVRTLVPKEAFVAGFIAGRHYTLEQVEDFIELAERTN